MRTREEIEQELAPIELGKTLRWGQISVSEKAILETLLDIRDLLSAKEGGE